LVQGGKPLTYLVGAISHFDLNGSDIGSSVLT
jgi:hypothetical protein